jgi:hypothetical protein
MKPRRVSISSRSKGRRPAPSSISSVTFDPEAGEFGHTERATLPSWRKHPFAILGGAALLAYVIGAIALQAFVDVDLVREWVTPRASAALNRTVHITEGTVGLFPRPSVQLSNIAVDNPPGVEGPTLARIDRVRLDLAWLPLFIGRVRVRGLHVDGAAVHLAVDENGRSNFGDLVPRRAADSSMTDVAPFAAALRRITVSDASLTYFDAPRARSMGVTGGDARIDVRRDGGEAAGNAWRADVTLDSDSLMVRAAGLVDEMIRVGGPTGQLSAWGGGPASAVQIDGGFLALAGDTLDVRGRVANLAEPQPSFEVELTGDDVSARTLTALLPADKRAELLPRAEGTLAVVLRLRGGLASSDRPTLDATVRLQGVTLRLRGEPVAEGVDGIVAMNAERITLDSLEGAFAGGPFRVSGIVRRDERASASVVAHVRPDLDVLHGLGLLPAGYTLSGNAELDLSVAGPLEAPDSLQVVGTAALHGFHLDHDELGAPVYVPEGVVNLAGRGITWSELPVLVGSDRVMTSGELDAVAGFWVESDGTPRIRASFAGPSLDLDAIFPPRLDEHPSYAEIAFAHLSGRPVDGRDASVVAGYMGMHRVAGMPLLGSLELRFDTLSQGDHRVEEVVATVELTDSMLAVSDASFDAWGGRARGSLRVALGGAARQQFALSLRLEDASAASFFDRPASEGEIVGTLDMEMELTGSTDPQLLPVRQDLVGEARLTLSDGRVTGTGVNFALADFLESERWTDVAFARLEGGIGIRDGGMVIENGHLDGEMGRFAFRGTVGFGGEADVSMALAVPSDQLDRLSLRRTGIGAGVLEQLKRSGRPLSLGLHLSGFVGAPTLEPNAANAVELAGR